MSGKYWSIRAFAKHIGVSDGAIRKARGAGRLSSKCFRDNPKSGKPEVIFEQCLLECQEAGIEIKNEAAKISIRPPVEAINKFEKKPSKKKKDVEEEDIDDEEERELVPRKARSTDTLAEANRLKAIHDANLKRSELMEANGQLIKRDVVYSKLFEVGNVVCTEMQGIPDKHIDNILAATSRAEAHDILKAAINNALTSLADTKNIKFGNH